MRPSRPISGDLSGIAHPAEPNDRLTGRAAELGIDKAHLLFADASDEFLDQVAQTVRLIRSKGIGVFFVTQLPDDGPDVVLAQLGSRIQHAHRAAGRQDGRARTHRPSRRGHPEGEEAGKAIKKEASGHGAPDTSAVTDYLKSREGRSMLNTIARGVFSMLKK